MAFLDLPKEFIPFTEWVSMKKKPKGEHVPIYLDKSHGDPRIWGYVPKTWYEQRVA